MLARHKKSRSNFPWEKILLPNSKNLGEKLKTVKGVAGATIMGDGRVGLILDMHGIFEIAQSNN